MAHGFLAPQQRDSGETWLDKKIDGAIAKSSVWLGKFINTKFNDLLFKLRTKERSPKPYSWSKEDSTPLQKMLSGSALQKALPSGSNAINPDVLGGDPVKHKNIVNFASGRLSPEPSAANAIYDTTAQAVDDNFFDKSTSSLGGGDSGEVVNAIDRLSFIMRTLVLATDEQTKNDSRIAREQSQETSKLARKAIVGAEEAGLEAGGVSSGNSAYLALAASGMGRMRAGRGGLGGGPGMGIGGKVATKKLLTAVGRRGAGRAGTRLGIAMGGKLGKGLGKTLGKKLGGKAVSKIAGGALAKSLGKKIPLVGLGLGAVFAAQRAMQGDFLGAGLELASGAASTVPGWGTAGSIGIDAALAARDMTKMDTGGKMSGFAENSVLSVNGNPLASFNEPGNREIIKIEKDGPDSGLKIGEGILEAQRKRKNIFGKLQAEGFKEYYDRGHGWDGFFDGFGETLKDILGAFTFPGGYKPFQFKSDGDGNEDNAVETISSTVDYGEKKGNWLTSKRNSGEQMEVNADGVFTSQIGGVVTKIGEQKDIGKYVDIVNEERGVTERIADISGVMPGIEVGSSITPGMPVAKGNDAGVIHYEIRDGGNADPEKYKARFGFNGTQDPTEFLKGINSNESLNNALIESNGNTSNDLNASSSEVALANQANSGLTVNNIVSASEGGGDNSTTVSNQIPIGSSMADMGGDVLSNLRIQTLVG